jgi:hypothetical protein
LKKHKNLEDQSAATRKLRVIHVQQMTDKRSYDSLTMTGGHPVAIVSSFQLLAEGIESHTEEKRRK